MAACLAAWLLAHIRGPFPPPPSQKGPQFASVGHVALRVRDIEASLAFYARLGIPEILRLTYDDGSLFLVYCRITDTQFLGLFPNGEGTRTPGREVVAINHLCLTVLDIDHTLAQLAAAGIPLTRPLEHD